MKRLQLLFIGLFLFAGVLYAQTADEIIEKHIKARGGEENWNKVESVEIKGNFTAFSESKPFIEYKTNEGLYYSEYYHGQHPMKDGIGKNGAWTVNPWFEIPFPRRAGGIEQLVMEQKAELCTPFYRYKEKDYKVELAGKETMEGVECFKLELTKPNQQKETWYINAATYLEYMSYSTWSDFGNPSQSENYYDNFTEVEGVIMPFYIERTFGIRNRVTEITSVKVNNEVDLSIFELPLSEEMDKIKFLLGEWNVSYSAMGRGGQFQTIDSTSSIISQEIGGNLFKEQLSYTRFFPITKLNHFSYNSVSEKYRITVFNNFYSNISVLEGNFSNDTLILDNSEISFTAESNASKQFTRFIISGITEDGFLLEIANSRDQGENWMVMQKFRYYRK